MIWSERVGLLFEGADNNEPPQKGMKKRGWDNAGFRQLAGKLHAIIVDELGESTGAMFIEHLCEDYGPSLLWIIPQFDIDKLSVMRKASKHHSEETQYEVRHTPPLLRTNFLVPGVSPDARKANALLFSHYKGGRPRSRAERDGARRVAREDMQSDRLEVYSERDDALAFKELLEPQFLKIPAYLQRAADFYEELGVVREEEEEVDGISSEQPDSSEDSWDSHSGA
jgi:hypothetical protein